MESSDVNIEWLYNLIEKMLWTLYQEWFYDVEVFSMAFVCGFTIFFLITIFHQVMRAKLIIKLPSVLYNKLITLETIGYFLENDMPLGHFWKDVGGGLHVTL